MTCHAIINPRSAGGRTGAALASLEARLQAAFPGLVVHHTRAPRDATTLAREITAAGATQLLVVGGDGTWHEVVQGCALRSAGVPHLAVAPAGAGAQVDFPSITLSLIPSGTGGDMRRSLGVPRDLGAAITQARFGAPRLVDVGRLSGRAPDGSTRQVVLANIASLGMSADTAARTHAGTVTKARLGPAAFLIEGLAAALRPQRHPVRITLDDAPPIERELLLVAICNGHSFGGGMRIAPAARVDDGWLDVVWIDTLPRPGVLALLPTVYPGAHRHLPWVHMRRVRRVMIEPLGPCPVEADGEVVDSEGSIVAEVLPGAIRVT